MNELYPIIRRKRVPLVVADVPAVVVGSVEPATVDAVTAAPLPTARTPDAEKEAE